MGRASRLAGWCARAWSGRRTGARHAPGKRRAVGVEPLERRRLLAGDLPDPVIEYSFDEGGGFDVIDSAPDGVQNNGVLNGDGGFLPEFRFGDTPDGSNSYLHFGDWNGWDYSFGGRVDTAEPLHPVLGGSASMAFYVRTYQLGQPMWWFSPGVTGAENQGGPNDVFWGNLTAEGGIRAVAGDRAGAASKAPLAGNGWHHVVHTRDADSGLIRTYVNGKLVASAVSDTGVMQAPFSSIGAATIHPFANPNFISGYYYFNGDLDQIEIYDQALSHTEVAALYGPPAASPPQAPAPWVDTSVIGAIKLEWSPVQGAVGYIVRVGDTADDLEAEHFVGVNELGGYESFTDSGLTPGTRRYFEVTAFNGQGESQPAAVNAVAAATGKGVLAHYWNSGFWGNDVRPGGLDGSWYVGQMPDETVGVGQSVVYDWNVGAPRPPFTGALRSDNFSTAFSGKIIAPESGEYVFVPRSDDDGILYVDGKLVSLDPFGHGLRDSPYYYPIFLVEGEQYEFLFLQAEQGGGAALQLNWLTPSALSTGWFPTAVPVDYLLADNDVPAAPVGLSYAPNGGGYAFDFTDVANNEWGYLLERRSPGGAFETVERGPIAAYMPIFDIDTKPVFRDVPVAAGTYEYRVRAYNADGSAHSNSVFITVAAGVAPRAGAQAFYINDGGWGTGRRPSAGALPIVGPGADFTETVVQVDTDFSGDPPFGSDIRHDGFSSVFTGKLRSQGAGLYQIFLESDDDGYLLVNGQVVSADPGGHFARDPRTVPDGVTRVFPITLAANTEYNFVALQSDRSANASAVMKWVRPGQTEAEIIPDSQFTSNRPNAAGGMPSGAPAAATSLRVDEPDLGATFLTLRWTDAATNELRYVIERSTSPDFANATVAQVPINATSYTDVDLIPSQRYYYRLNAANFYGQHATTLDVTTLARERLPAAPTNLRAVARAAGVNLLFTDGSTSEDEFVIERAPADSTVFSIVARVPGTGRGVTGDTVRFTDPTAAAGTEYAYRVYASNSGGASGTSNTFVIRAGSPGGSGGDAVYYDDQFFTGATVSASGVPATRNFGFASPAPGIEPDTFSGVVQAELLAEFSEPYTFHTASDDGIDLTIIDRDTGQVLLSGPPNGILLSRGMPTTGFQEAVGIVNLTAGRRYLIEWRFSDGNGAAGYRVGWSSPSVPQEVIPSELLFPVSGAGVPLFAVGGLGASAFGAESVMVRWADRNFGESGFLVERRRASDPAGAFEEVGMAPANASSFSDTTGVERGVLYEYRVTAVRGGEAGPLGGTVSVLPGSTGGFTYTGTATLLPGADGSVNQAADNVALLTSSATGAQVGSAFTNNAVSVVTHGVPSLFGPGRVRGFTVQFDFAYTGGDWSGPEGLAFVIQRNRPDVLGNAGYESGYGGIDNSFAVAFQPAFLTTYTYVNGTIFPGGPQDLPFFFGFTPTQVELEYNAVERKLIQRLTQLGDAGQTFERVYFGAYGLGEFGVEELQPLDIPAMIGGPYGFFGFTGAGPHLQQAVSNFAINGVPVHFLPTGAPPPPPSTTAPNAAPTARAGGPYRIVEGQSVTLDATLSDDPDGDQLLYEWDLNDDGVFGDFTGANPTLDWFWLEHFGIYDGPDTYTIAVRVTDGEAPASVATATVTLENAPPTSFFGVVNSTLVEGGEAEFYFDFTQTWDSSPLDRMAGFTCSYAVDWNRDGQFDDGEILAGRNNSFESITFGDNGVFNVRGRITDKDGGYSDYVATVTVSNADPAVSQDISGLAGPRAVNTAVTANVTFGDAGTLDTHTVVWDWGDGTTSAGTVSGGGASGTHHYAAAGLYRVLVTVTDDDGGVGYAAYQHVIVYDPSLGNASGSGWVQTDGGRAAFSFDVRYARNALTPSGNVTFNLPGMAFKATSFDWMVVKRGGTTYIHGHGTLNRIGGYSFLLTVSDAARERTAHDRLRMKIWSDATGEVVFDNQWGDPDEADPILDIGGGNIVLPA